MANTVIDLFEKEDDMINHSSILCNHFTRPVVIIINL
jgi:hypothetical protein